MPHADTMQLEIKLFRMVCSVSIVFSILFFCIDTFIKKEYISSTISFFSTVNFAFFYYRIRYRGDFEKLVTPFILLLLIIVNLAWFTGGGLNLSNAVIFFLTLIFILFISPRRYRLYLLVFIFFNMAVLTGLEFFHLGYSRQNFKNDTVLAVDTVILFTAFGLTTFGILFFKNQYDLERETVNKQNRELDAFNSEIEAQNEELVQYQEEVMAQRDFIDEKNKILEKQAEELHQANDQIQAVNNNLEKTVKERTKKLTNLNNDLDLLIYRSSHDFRRPITTLLGLCEIARLTKTDDLSKELFEKVSKTAVNMDKMLTKFFMLYNINHYRVGEPTYITLKEIIEMIDKKFISRKSSITFKHKIDVKNYDGQNDPRNNLIEVILENLTENSLIYHNKSHIEIDLKILEKDGNLHIIQQDNGNGIPAAHRNQIFDMYFRGSTLSTGNGLGLYVAKRAADLLHASVELTSEEDQFTRFEIVFKI